MVRTDDLAFVAAGAIARPVNAELRAITPLMRRLEIAGGDALERQLRVNEPLEVGSAVVTDGGSLAAELLIHAVVSSETEPVSRTSVRRATLSAMQRASDWRIDDVAIAPFGLGAGNLDVDECAEVMVDVLARHLATAAHPATVTIVVESDAEADAFRRRVEWATR